MKRISRYIPIFLISLWAASCATSYPTLVQTSLNTALGLKNYYEEIGIKSSKADEARNLIGQGLNLLEDEYAEPDAAYYYFDRAALIYRMIMAEREYAISQERLTRARKGLSATRLELETYQERLRKLKLPIVESNL
ncbi:MAG: hypothetical protein V3V52_05595 [Candidatus Adiutricales bacterium]